MIISYEAVGGSTYAVLYSDTDTTGSPLDSVCAPSAMDHFAPSFSPVVQTANLFQSAAKFRAPQGNIQATLTMDYFSFYATRAAALASTALVKAAVVNVALNLKVVQDSTTVGSQWDSRAARAARVARMTPATASVRGSRAFD